MESLAQRIKNRILKTQIFLPSGLRRCSRSQWTAWYTGSPENQVLFQSANGLEQVTPSLSACASPWALAHVLWLRNQDIWKATVSEYSFIACSVHWCLGFQWVCTFYSSWTILFKWVIQVHPVFFPLLGWWSKCYHRVKDLILNCIFTKRYLCQFQMLYFQ